MVDFYVCDDKDTTKNQRLKRALETGITVVTSDFVTTCAEQGKLLDANKFVLVRGSGHAGSSSSSNIEELRQLLAQLDTPNKKYKPGSIDDWEVNYFKQRQQEHHLDLYLQPPAPVPVNVLKCEIDPGDFPSGNSIGG